MRLGKRKLMFRAFILSPHYTTYRIEKLATFPLVRLTSLGDRGRISEKQISCYLSVLDGGQTR